jgi:glycosyltransferase involved in cell wall biosynthesis
VQTNIKKRRILLFAPIFFPDTGGPAIQGKFLAELLCQNGFEVYVIKFRKTDFIHSDIKIISLNWSSNPNFFERLFRWCVGPLISIFYLVKIRPCLVIVNSVFWNGMFMGFICRLAGIPTILKFAGDWVFENINTAKDLEVNLNDIYQASRINKMLYKIEKYFVSKFNVIWVISDYRKKNVEFLTNKPKIWLQNNFHELPEFKDLNSIRFNSPIIFVTAARLIPHKRIDVLIRTLSKLNYDYRFIIVGEGSEFDSLQRLANNLGLSKKVFFLGKISSGLLYQILGLASVYLSWSSEEGAPNSFIEAMHFGLPIFTANVGGIPEMFDSDTKAAKLISADNPSELFDSLRNLDLMPDNLKVMSLSSISEGRKFLKSENEKKVIEFVENLLFEFK